MNVYFTAYFALWVWAALVLGAFAVLRPLTAATLAFLGAVLLLPSGYAMDLPGFPSLGRNSLTALAIYAGLLLFARHRLRRRDFGRGPEIFVLLIVMGKFATAATNADPLSYGPTSLPGMTTYDAFSSVLEFLLEIGLPFLAGRLLVRSPRELRPVLGLLLVAMIFYSLLVLYEIRMSPQLHRIVYGYHPTPFRQAIRGEGFRPFVFTGHGLILAGLLAQSCVAAGGFARARLRVLGLSGGVVGAYLFGVLLLCRSLAATVYVTTVLPMLTLLRPRLQAKLVLCVFALIYAYPGLRAADLVPTESFVGAAALVSDERASSLEFRFEQERQLLKKARERPWFGWGGWGRASVYDEEYGRKRSTTDSFWIIQLSGGGILGAVCHLSLFLIALPVAALRIRSVRDPGDRALLLAAMWSVAIMGVNFLIGVGLTGYHIFLAGALAGATWSLRAPGRRGPQTPHPSNRWQPEPPSLQGPGITPASRSPREFHSARAQT